jgi:hypothetical protein
MKPVAFSLALAVLVVSACEDRPTEARAAAPNGPQFDQTPAPPRAAGFIGAAPIDLQAQTVAIGPFAFRAFVPTGSTSTNCLATLRESNVATTPMNLFCAPRTFNGVNGVLVAIFFNAPVGSDAAVGITLYQDGANSYGTPVLFPN